LREDVVDTVGIEDVSLVYCPICKTPVATRDAADPSKFACSCGHSFTNPIPAGGILPATSTGVEQTRLCSACGVEGSHTRYEGGTCVCMSCGYETKGEGEARSLPKTTKELRRVQQSNTQYLRLTLKKHNIIMGDLAPNIQEALLRELEHFKSLYSSEREDLWKQRYQSYMNDRVKQIRVMIMHGRGRSG